ncbi:ribosomal-processing cysteine protease Prp [Kineosporia succinea]|uniref:Uncharacterized protein YsxB (DUF464 family) n=1 Tax=Kineosporia succinea TaxID=84632 RepID=A0ABT9PBR6_9ACTN|nr:hypothetical protein [Kineosporia succinea]MDP9829460.1 uncharacterized protein YsxB (DUF464 family) [Kineosporia succinea]
MIAIHALLREGVTHIEVTGHERGPGQVGDEGRVCAAVTAITRTATLGLLAVAEEYPDLVSINLTEE